MRDFSSIRHVIWDWNGTLLNDCALCVEVINGVLAERRMPTVDVETYRLRFSFPVIDYYRVLGFDFSREPFEVVSQAFVDGYTRQWRACGLQAGARAVLARLDAAGYRQSVLSASHQEPLEEALAHYGLAGFFSDVVGQDNVHGRGKLERGREWLRESGLPAAQAVLVGDTVHDFEVAEALGTACILLDHGHYAGERLAACPAAVVRSLETAANLILDTPRSPNADGAHLVG